ncbi:MAG TPA: hypothetical protein VD995_16165 [Azospirillum sp.]|nr:hypothetical protein [Azospirillum sp.]
MKGPALALALAIAATSLPTGGHAADLLLAQAQTPAPNAAPAPHATPIPPLPPLPKLPQVSDETSWAQRNQSFALGLGAIGGVVAFNVLTGGLGALPLVGAEAAATATGAVSATEGAVAVSRVYAVTSAVAGALAMDWLVNKPKGAGMNRVPVAVSARVAPGP